MHSTTFVLILGMVLLSSSMQSNFISEQKKYERVRTAIDEKQDYLKKILSQKNMTLDNLHLLLVAYKEDNLLEVYAKTKQETTYRKILKYPICARSGLLGPKRKEGDGQVPEGFYHIDRLNPNSNFYLSLGLNYPNLSDQRQSKADHLGGDIFIHGSCITIGCLPMTDSYIKEIYLLAVHARNNGQTKIPVYIFPFQMTAQKFANYKVKFKDNEALIAFWGNLKTGYDKFTKDLQALNIQVSSSGLYKY